MKTHLFIALLCATAFAARAQSTAFIYQGRLAANSSPYTGLAEMQFTLFSTLTGGVAVATNTPVIGSVNVTAGLLVASLDFGAAAFPGADRFLEIQVRTNIGAFTTLTPRQPLTPTPYAVYARTTAGTAQGPWVASGSDLSYTGIVGIGITNPQARLDVRGDIRLGASGQYRVASGEENLRVIRGTVDFNGTVLEGQGTFTVEHVNEGDNRIDFATAFSSAPSVTATVDDMAESLLDFDYYVAGIFSSSTSSVRIRTRAHSASILTATGPINRKFHFIAVGPR